MLKETKLPGQGNLCADFFAPVHRASDYDGGYRLMLDGILAGEDTKLILALACTTDFQRGTKDCSTGAMAAICDCLDALDAGGKSLQLSDAARALMPDLAVVALRATGEMRRSLLRCTLPENYGATLALLCTAARAAGPYLKRAEPKPPQPVPVAIVSQPDTRSVQTVERDAADEITRTVTETKTSG